MTVEVSELMPNTFSSRDVWRQLDEHERRLNTSILFLVFGIRTQ